VSAVAAVAAVVDTWVVCVVGVAIQAAGLGRWA
jgi:hypothetical protein